TPGQPSRSHAASSRITTSAAPSSTRRVDIPCSENRSGPKRKTVIPLNNRTRFQLNTGLPLLPLTARRELRQVDQPQTAVDPVGPQRQRLIIRRQPHPPAFVAGEVQRQGRVIVKLLRIRVVTLQPRHTIHRAGDVNPAFPRRRDFVKRRGPRSEEHTS